MDTHSTQDFLHEIFIARCKDTGDRPRKDDATEFSNMVGSNVCYIADREAYVITLRECRLGPNTALTISKMIKNIPVVEKIDLYGNGMYIWCMRTAHRRLVIQDIGAAAIVDAIKTSSSVRHLNLGCNDICDEGGKAIGQMLKFNKSVCRFFLYWCAL
jgi:hypothetical protein